MKDIIIGAIVTLVCVIIIVGSSFFVGKSVASQSYAEKIAAIQREADEKIAQVRKTESALKTELALKDSAIESMEKEHAKTVAAVVSDNGRLRLKASSYACIRMPENSGPTGKVVETAPELLQADSVAVLTAAAGCAQVVRERDELKDRYLTVQRLMVQ